jgi:hypothetical protein
VDGAPVERVKADGLLETAYSILACTSGKIDEGVRHGIESQRLLRETSDEELRALAPWSGSYPHVVAGQLPRARELLQALLDSTRGHPSGVSRCGTSAPGRGATMLGASRSTPQLGTAKD